jgi:hypothetical protein
MLSIEDKGYLSPSVGYIPHTINLSATDIQLHTWNTEGVSVKSHSKKTDGGY